MIKYINFCLLLIFSFSANAEKLNLICTTDQYYNVERQQYEDILAENFTIIQQGDQVGKKIVLEMHPDFCKIYISTINDDVIEGDCTMDLTEDKKLKQVLIINRYSGIMRHTFIINKKFISYTNSNCRKAEKKF